MQDKIKSLLTDGHVLKAIAFTSEAIELEHPEAPAMVLLINDHYFREEMFADVLDY